MNQMGWVNIICKCVATVHIIYTNVYELELVEHDPNRKNQI